MTCVWSSPAELEFVLTPSASMDCAWRRTMTMSPGWKVRWVFPSFLLEVPVVQPALFDTCKDSAEGTKPAGTVMGMLLEVVDGVVALGWTGIDRSGRGSDVDGKGELAADCDHRAGDVGCNNTNGINGVGSDMLGMLRRQVHVQLTSMREVS
eukprot:CAMPEP_0197720022 /NCGR_PEP_ID=MMETSP1434-20131217/3525_1 /TAXON_ID=265543 /ORGANISM="Minutocellus polymorphus, Strain CCMP3303" /LENGTH=151 /DNA_ID=CAMNT_0043304819 /DNA_START=130 /DNA_END=587 /DNA_ORIENTATION=-